MLVPGAEELLLPDDEVRALSPRYNPPAPHIPLVVAVGGMETSEWIRQTEDTMVVLRDQGRPGGLPQAGVRPALFDPYVAGETPLSELCAAMLRQMGLPAKDPYIFGDVCLVSALRSTGHSSGRLAATGAICLTKETSRRLGECRK